MNLKPWRRALYATVFLRLICSVFAWRLGQVVLPNPALASANALSSMAMSPTEGWRYLLYGIWQRFDTLWYLDIAAHGYARPEATVFYPLYPFLIRCMTWVVREPTVAALTVSTVACFFLLWGLQKLAALDWPGTEAYAAAIFAAWPASFIFLAGYPESLFIGLVIWCIYFARRDRWWAAGAFGFFAGLSKAAGVLVAIPLCYLFVRDRKWGNVPAVALAPLGFLGYTLWLKFSGFPMANTIYAKYWVTTVAPPWATLWDGFKAVSEGDWLVGIDLTALLFCIAVLVVAKRIRVEYLLFSVACIILFLTKHTDPVLQSTVRYVLLIFPVFFYCASLIKNRVVLFLILLACCPIYFGMLRTFLWWGLLV